MLQILEIVVGFALIYLGFSGISRSGRLGAFLLAIAAISGLVFIVHGTLILLVPNFFRPSI